MPEDFDEAMREFRENDQRRKRDFKRRFDAAPIEQLLAGRTLPDGTSGEEAARMLREAAEEFDDGGDDDA